MTIDADNGILLKHESPFQETMLGTNVIVRLSFFRLFPSCYFAD